MELQQLRNLTETWDDITHRHDAEVRIIIPGPAPVSVGILSINWSEDKGCFLLIPDDEDVVGL